LPYLTIEGMLPFDYSITLKLGDAHVTRTIKNP